MSASQASVSRKKQVLEKKIKQEQTKFDELKKDTKPKDDEKIWVLETKKLRKERELKNSYWFQCMAIFFFFAIIRLSLNQDIIFIYFIISL